MSRQNITSAQLVKLQTLYSQWAAHEQDVHGGRESRLAWAGQVLGRAVTSFRDLTRSEAASLIDVLAGSTGQAKARDYGTAGRRRQEAGGRRQDAMVSPQDLARIQDALTRLGWSQERFEAWLRSPSSPLGAKRASNPQIRTFADARKVWFALKRILKAGGRWQEAGKPLNAEAAETAEEARV